MRSLSNEAANTAKAHCCLGKFLIGSTGSYKAEKRLNLTCRHSREGGNPSCFLHQSNMDSRLRGNDGHESWVFVKNKSLAGKRLKPRHLQHFLGVNKISPDSSGRKPG